MYGSVGNGIERTESLPVESIILSIIRSAQELNQSELLQKAIEAGLTNAAILNGLKRLMKEKQNGYTTENKTTSTESTIMATSGYKQKQSAVLTLLKESREGGMQSYLKQLIFLIFNHFMEF